jgi:hypothetical protein
VDSKQSIEAAFMPFFVQAKKAQLELSAITSPKIARAARLEVRGIRIAAENKRKELNEDAKIRTNAINWANKLLLSIVEPLETSLEDIELAEARKIVAEREAWTKVRLETIQPYLDPTLPVPNLTDITDDQFEAMLEDAKVAHAARLERQRKEEADRIAKEQEEKERLERLRVENEKLKQQAAVTAQKLADERAEAARVLAAQQAKAAQEALEAKKKADAQAELLRQERLGREAAERKAAAAAPAPASTQAPADSGDGVKRSIAEQQELGLIPPPATDREKLLVVAGIFRSVPMPVVTSLGAGEILKKIVQSRDNFAKWIEDKAATIPDGGLPPTMPKEVDL